MGSKGALSRSNAQLNVSTDRHSRARIRSARHTNLASELGRSRIRPACGSCPFNQMSFPRTEEARGSNPLTSTPQSPGHRPGGSHPPGRRCSRFPHRAANGQQPRTKRPTATRLRPGDGAKRTPARPSDYESKSLRPAGAIAAGSGCSRQRGRPLSTFLTCRVTAGGMTKGMTRPTLGGPPNHGDLPVPIGRSSTHQEAHLPPLWLDGRSGTFRRRIGCQGKRSPRRRLAVAWWPARTRRSCAPGGGSAGRGQADQLGAHLPQPGPLWRCSMVLLS
jgi:hypothetical protein